MSREVLQQALEAMEASDDSAESMLDATHEARKVLAQPDNTSKPYEELRSIIDGGSESFTHKDAVQYLKEMQDWEAIAADQAMTIAMMKTEQEPTAWQVRVEHESMKEFPMKDMTHNWCVQQKLSGSAYRYRIRPLYISPPQRKPLTDVEINEIVDAYTEDSQGYDLWCNGKGVARAIEAAHGIGDKT